MGEDLRIVCWKSGKAGSSAKPVRTWIAELDDQSFKQVDKLLTMLRMEKKNLGMPYSRHLGDGLHELRDQRQSGAGYRLYYCWEGETLVVLLVGGDKSTQSVDIETAKRRMKSEE